MQRAQRIDALVCAGMECACTAVKAKANLGYLFEDLYVLCVLCFFALNLFGDEAGFVAQSPAGVAESAFLAIDAHGEIGKQPQ